MPRDPGLIADPLTGQHRCWWCGDDPLYVGYHDHEWGMPVADDGRLLEKICLEGFQAGLSWLTILRKREHFRTAFSNFEAERVACYTPREIETLVQNAGIVRHRGKIVSTINNARRALEIGEAFGSLAAYIWRFEPGRATKLRGLADINSESTESKALSKDLKQRGWTFVGPTICYAFMQAMGMVNDHLIGCSQWPVIDNARSNFVRPA